MIAGVICTPVAPIFAEAVGSATNTQPHGWELGRYASITIQSPFQILQGARSSALRAPKAPDTPKGEEQLARPAFSHQSEGGWTTTATSKQTRITAGSYGSSVTWKARYVVEMLPASSIATGRSNFLSPDTTTKRWHCANDVVVVESDGRSLLAIRHGQARG